MPKWDISKIWDGKSCFIIGGGSSLKGFDWSLLSSELTIGCNDAYKLGENICKVCIFGDNKWWNANSEELKKYKGQIFTNLGVLKTKDIPWVNHLDRKPKGFHTDALGWNNNTGFAAINLALLFGANPIYLLGFDMKLIEGVNNWHPNRLDKISQHVFIKFLRNESIIDKDWRTKFSNQQIINITNDSNLAVFPKVNFDAFWKSWKELS